MRQFIYFVLTVAGFTFAGYIVGNPVVGLLFGTILGLLFYGKE